MKKSLTTWVIFALILVGALTIIGIIKTSKNKVYYGLEEDLLESSRLYYSQFPETLPTGAVAITSKKLLEETYLKSLNNKGDECEGYVIVSKKGLTHDYKAYIKCDKYTTKKYDDKKNVDGEV